MIPRILGYKEIRLLDIAIHDKYSKEGTYPQNQHYSYWERQSPFWDKTASPVRPSKNDLEIYGDFLKRKKKKKNILILGSTPELRDLVAREKEARVYVADFSQSMPLAMLKFAYDADPRKEIWIKDNWLDLAFPEHFFDIILGDVVLHQLTPDLEIKFMEKMRSLLKNNGLFITRTFFLDKIFLQQDFTAMTKQMAESSLEHKQKVTLLRLQTVWFCSDLSSRKFDRHRSVKLFEGFLRENKKPFLKRIYDDLVADMDSYRSWSPPEEVRLIKVISSHFSIVDRKIANDYPHAKYFPIFLLKPNKPNSRKQGIITAVDNHR